MDYVILLLAILLVGWCILRDMWMTTKVWRYVDSLMTLAHARNLTEAKLVGMVTDSSRPLHKDHFTTLTEIAEAPPAPTPVTTATGRVGDMPDSYL